MLPPLFALTSSLIARLVIARKTYGQLDTTGSNDPVLAGNVVVLLSPLVTLLILTLIFGLNHLNWSSMYEILKGKDHKIAEHAGVDIETVPVGQQCQPQAASEAEAVQSSRRLHFQDAHGGHDARVSNPLAHAYVRVRLHPQQAIPHWLGHRWHHLDRLQSARYGTDSRVPGPQGAGECRSIRVSRSH